MRGRKFIIFCLITLFPLTVMLSNCWRSTPKADVRGPAYAGSASCMSCHRDISLSYAHTAHFATSRAASVHSVHALFDGGRNTLSFVNGQKITVTHRDSSLYQAGYANGKLQEQHRMDIAIGQVKAETYLYWKDKQLFELPLSWFSVLHSWTNSPGYAPDEINFSRPVAVRCLECHSSYIHEVPQQSLVRTKVEYDRHTLISGIDCERCHGPAAQHVSYHTENPGDRQPHFITSFRRLTRNQKLDACAVCHSGNTEKFQASAFDFKMGDTLADFKYPELYKPVIDAATLDVHGNQNGLLAGSKCFLMSNMDCTTCHNTHANERDNTLLYVQRCMNCHNTTNHNTCKMLASAGQGVIKNKCVDCHMPLQASAAINVQTATQRNALPYQVHTHRIAIYPEETKRVLALAQQLP